MTVEKTESSEVNAATLQRGSKASPVRSIDCLPSPCITNFVFDHCWVTGSATPCRAKTRKGLKLGTTTERMSVKQPMCLAGQTPATRFKIRLPASKNAGRPLSVNHWSQRIGHRHCRIVIESVIHLAVQRRTQAARHHSRKTICWTQATKQKLIRRRHCAARPRGLEPEFGSGLRPAGVGQASSLTVDGASVPRRTMRETVPAKFAGQDDRRTVRLEA